MLCNIKQRNKGKVQNKKNIYELPTYTYLSNVIVAPESGSTLFDVFL